MVILQSFNHGSDNTVKIIVALQNTAKKFKKYCNLHIENPNIKYYLAVLTVKPSCCEFNPIQSF
jgi:hypothetical protein